MATREIKKYKKKRNKVLKASIELLKETVAELHEVIQEKKLKPVA